MILNTPYIKTLIRNHFVGLSSYSQPAYIPCYIHSVTALVARPHLFNIHLESGALYWRIPLWQLGMSSVYNPASKIEPWGVISPRSQVIEINYLKGYVPRIPHLDAYGYYRFTIEPLEGAYGEDPEQAKALHFIELISGGFALLPNNMLEFRDSHFTNDEPMPRYGRQTEYYRANG